MIAYTYARRDLIAALQRPGVQLVQGPLSLSNLRALLTDLVIRDILGDPRGALRPSSAPASCPRCGAALAARTSEVP